MIMTISANSVDDNMDIATVHDFINTANEELNHK